MTPGFCLSAGMGDTLRAGTSRPPLDPEACASTKQEHHTGREGIIFSASKAERGSEQLLENSRCSSNQYFKTNPMTCPGACNATYFEMHQK